MTGKQPNGMGTIAQRKDGRWHGAAYVYTPTGERVRKYVYGKTWEEVNNKRLELLENNRKGIPSVTSNMKLGEYLDYWLAEVVAVELGRSTYTGYEVVVRRYLKPYLGRKRINGLNPADVRSMIGKLRKHKIGTDTDGNDKFMSARYVENVFEVLRSALSNAVRSELIARNVAQLVKAPSREHYEVQPLDERKARKFLEHASNHWLRALWLILITTGLRKGEVLGLAWSDIDLLTGAFRVRRTVQRVRGQLVFGPPKTKRSRRTLYLSPACLEALKRHRRETDDRMVDHLNLAPGQPDDLVFVTKTGRVIEPRNVNTMLDRLIKKTKIDPTRVHDLRHTCASLLLMDGATAREVMEQLGHSSIKVTMDVYGHVMDEAKRSMAVRMDRVLA